MTERPAITDADMFAERTPEAAARQIGIVAAELAEHHLTILAGMLLAPRVSKKRLARQQEICELAIRHLRELKVPPRGMGGRHLMFLDGALQAGPEVARW